MPLDFATSGDSLATVPRFWPPRQRATPRRLGACGQRLLPSDIRAILEIPRLAEDGLTCA
jgi:hypothetical protein